MQKRLLAFFFEQLYHRLAWAYDLVAWSVSAGSWNQWGRSILGLLPAGRILELGFGPGHFQLDLKNNLVYAFGLDESWQMARQAARRTNSRRLVRGRSENAPFASGAFEAIVAIFPAPYIFKPQTAAQIARLLTPNGQLLVLLAARPAGLGIIDRWVRFIFRLSGGIPSTGQDFSSLIEMYGRAGIQVKIEWREQNKASLLYLTGWKRNKDV